MSHDESPIEKLRKLEALLYEQLKAAEADWRAAGNQRKASAERSEGVPSPDGTLIRSWNHELAYRDVYSKALKRYTNLVVHRIPPESDT